MPRSSASTTSLPPRGNEYDGEAHRLATVRQLEQRHGTITAKLDRGYEDYVSGRISDEFWTRKSQEWETELQAVQTLRVTPVMEAKLTDHVWTVSELLTA